MKNTKIFNGLSFTRKMSLQDTPSKLNNFSRKPEFKAFVSQVRAAKTFLMPAIIAMIALIGLGFSGCEDEETSCSHNWVWRVTTQAGIGAPGLETETCSICGVNSGRTQTIEQLKADEEEINEQSVIEKEESNESSVNEKEESNESSVNEKEEGNESSVNEKGEGNESSVNEKGEGNESSVKEKKESNESSVNEKEEGNESSTNDDDEISGPFYKDKYPPNELLYIINISLIKGVFQSKQPLTFSKTIEETEQFTGTVRCYSSGANMKTDNSSFIIRITLIPKDGFTLNGVEENFFKVEGAASATNAANSGVITIVYFNQEFDSDGISLQETELIMVDSISYYPAPPDLQMPDFTGPRRESPNPYDIGYNEDNLYFEFFEYFSKYY